ncbi:DsbA family protein [Brachybacterium sp. DNPG3]
MLENLFRRPLALAIAGAAVCFLVVTLVAAVVIVGGIFFFNSSSSDDAGTRTGTAAEPTGAAEQAEGSGALVAPPGVAEDQAYLELSTSADGPVVDVYLDFLCPHCATFQDVSGGDLTELAEAGDITLRVHPRPMLDLSSSPEGYSGRAANAAVCAYAEDPASWSAVEEALFAHQPGAEGLSDDELVQIVEEASGIDVADCVAAGTYIPWLEDVVEPEASAQGIGTPVVLIDGVQSSADWSVAGELREEIEQAG